MWNKRDDATAPQDTNSGAGAAPAREAPQPRPANSPAASPQRGPTATIGASMHIKGEISSREELLVDGDVEGSLESQSTITVGPNGKVRANIKAREVVIFGSVHGNVDATEKVVMRDKGSLVGDVKTAGISIDDGAYLKGCVDIIRAESKPMGKAPRPEPEIKAQAG